MFGRFQSMPRYFFDTRDQDVFVEDEVGLELPNLESAKAQAAATLGTVAREVTPKRETWELVVYVRDERQPVLTARLRFEAIVEARRRG